MHFCNLGDINFDAKAPQYFPKVLLNYDPCTMPCKAEDFKQPDLKEGEGFIH